MKPHFTYFIFFINYIFCCNVIDAQNLTADEKKLSRAIFELSAGSVDVNDYTDPQNGDLYPLFDNSIHAALLISPFKSKTFKTGIQYNYIWNTINKKTLDNYYIVGLVGRYDLPLTRKFMLFGDININYGNYCNCEQVENVEELPFKKDIVYAGLNIGLSYHLVKSLWLYGSISFYEELIKAPPYTYGYAQPLLGLQLQIE